MGVHLVILKSCFQLLEIERSNEKLVASFSTVFFSFLFFSFDNQKMNKKRKKIATSTV
jgi:hypothetical protein